MLGLPIFNSRDCTPRYARLPWARLSCPWRKQYYRFAYRRVKTLNSELPI